jgi:hypothetical protein
MRILILALNFFSSSPLCADTPALGLSPTPHTAPSATPSSDVNPMLRNTRIKSMNKSKSKPPLSPIGGANNDGQALGVKGSAVHF